MVVWLLLSCQLAKRERDWEEEGERERDEPFLYFFISSFNLSLTFAASLNSFHPSLSFYTLYFSQLAINLSIRTSVLVAHQSQVTIFHLYFVSFFSMCASISPSLPLSVNLSILWSRRKLACQVWKHKSGRKTEGKRERKENLKMRGQTVQLCFYKWESEQTNVSEINEIMPKNCIYMLVVTHQ